jgi:hypothetical protein
MTKNLKDLTTSQIARQSALNNPFAVQKIEKELKPLYGFDGILWNENPIFLKSQVASLFEIDERTIERYLSSNEEELKKNGYEILRGAELKKFKDFLSVSDIDVVDLKLLAKVPQLGIFNFRSVLNLAMLLTESRKAKEMRARILDIAISVITKKSGGNAKYINQRDVDYLPTSFQEVNYRGEFTTALNECVKANNWKYSKYTNLIYKAIFEEDASEYKKILNLSQNDTARDTFYAEIIDVVSSFETGFAEKLNEEFKKLGRVLSIKEADDLFQNFTNQSVLKPFITKARIAMSSRDLNFRDALHKKLEHYIQAIPEADYEKFLGEKSKDLEDRIKDDLEIYKRLKDR